MSDAQERLADAPLFVAPPSVKQVTCLALLCLILLAAFALRVRGLNTLLDAVHYDEAYYAVDALSLVEHPRLQPFFDDNFGREGLWMALLAPFLAVFGPDAFAIRLTALFVGVLTVAAVARLGREAMDRTGAIYAAAGLAVLYWHIHLSHLGFRALTLPWMGALAFGFLLRAMKRSGRRRTTAGLARDWLMAGLCFGLLAYTYTAARAWLALAVVMLVVAFLGGHKRAVVTVLAAAVVVAPLVLYLLMNPAAAAQRIDQVALGGAEGLLVNLVAWGPVWFSAGPADIIYNLPGRPLLDPALALLLIGGLLAALASQRRPEQWRSHAVALGLTFFMLVTALAPALLTTEPLRWLRAVGIVVPVALLIGLAGSRLHATLNRLRFRPLWIPGLLLAISGVVALRDVDSWLADPHLSQPMERALVQGIERMSEVAPPGAAVAFAPFILDHPVLRLRQSVLADHWVSAYLPEECLMFADEPSFLFAQSAFTAGLVDRLERYASVEPVADDGADPQLWTIWRVMPDAQLTQESATVFGGLLAARSVEPPPQSAAPGEVLDLALALRRTGPIDRSYTAFVHLYDDGGGAISLVAQVDRPICPGSPPLRWRADEIAVLPMPLALPPDLPAGTYRLAFGIYEAPAGARLPADAGDVVTLGMLTVNS